MLFFLKIQTLKSLKITLQNAREKNMPLRAFIYKAYKASKKVCNKNWAILYDFYCTRTHHSSPAF